MKTVSVFICVFACFLLGCLNLKKVNDFAKASAKTVEKYDELNVTFTQACRERCLLQQVRDGRLALDMCLCPDEEAADSVFFAMVGAARAYFNGLGKLSGNDLSSFKTNALARQLKAGTFGDLEINDATVDAYNKISTILLRAITDGYRQNKIKTYIAEANGPLQVLLGFMSFNLSQNVLGKSNVNRQRLASIYTDFVDDSLASLYDKKNAIEAYHKSITELDAKQTKIRTFSQALKKVSTGHQKLYDARNHLTAREISTMLVQFARDLEDIAAQLDKLKK